MMKYYLDNVRDGNQKGWLKVSLLDSREIMIPYGLIVEKLFTDKKTITYKILEGVYQGALITVPASEAKVFLPNKEKKTLDIQINIQSKQLRIDNKNYPVIIDRLLKVGIYNIYIPDRPHKEINICKYQDESSGGSRFASTWFRIASTEDNMFNSNRYLHFGTYSHGCITFPYHRTTNRSPWSDIVMQLSRTRIKPGICSQLLITQ